jgi:hypothetical protein
MCTKYLFYHRALLQIFLINLKKICLLLLYLCHNYSLIIKEVSHSTYCKLITLKTLATGVSIISSCCVVLFCPHSEREKTFSMDYKRRYFFNIAVNDLRLRVSLQVLVPAHNMPCSDVNRKKVCVISVYMLSQKGSIA